MFEPLYAQIIAWVGLALLLVLCLPFAAVHKLILEVSAFLLRIALLCVLGAAAYLWFQPGDLPAAVTSTFNDLPQWRTNLPEPGTQYFGVCAAALIVVPLLPLLALVDVSRKLAGWRLCRLRALAAEPKVVPTVSEPAGARPAVVVRRVDRREAANTLADAGSGKSVHTAG
jgi:hypothetical protein